MTHRNALEKPSKAIRSTNPIMENTTFRTIPIRLIMMKNRTIPTVISRIIPPPFLIKQHHLIQVDDRKDFCNHLFPPHDRHFRQTDFTKIPCHKSPPFVPIQYTGKEVICQDLSSRSVQKFIISSARGSSREGYGGRWGISALNLRPGHKTCPFVRNPHQEFVKTFREPK